MGGRSLVARVGTAGVASLHGQCCDFARRGRMSVATDVRLDPHPGRHMWVLQLEGGSFGTDPGEFSEIVPRGWARGRHSSELQNTHGSSTVTTLP